MEEGGDQGLSFDHLLCWARKDSRENTGLPEPTEPEREDGLGNKGAVVSAARHRGQRNRSTGVTTGAPEGLL